MRRRRALHSGLPPNGPVIPRADVPYSSLFAHHSSLATAFLGPPSPSGAHTNPILAIAHEHRCAEGALECGRKAAAFSLVLGLRRCERMALKAKELTQ